MSFESKRFAMFIVPVCAGIFGIAGMALGACKPSGSEGTETTKAATSATAAPTVSASSLARTNPPPSAEANSNEANLLSGLMEKLQGERANRPPIQPNADQVFDTIVNKLKIPVSDRKQVAGWTIGAKYCEKAVTAHEVHIVACEFVDVPTATKGLELASVTNKDLKGREVLLRKSTTLSVHRTNEGPDAQSEAKKIKDAFTVM